MIINKVIKNRKYLFLFLTAIVSSLIGGSYTLGLTNKWYWLVATCDFLGPFALLVYIRMTIKAKNIWESILITAITGASNAIGSLLSLYFWG